MYSLLKGCLKLSLHAVGVFSHFDDIDINRVLMLALLVINRASFFLLVLNLGNEF